MTGKNSNSSDERISVLYVDDEKDFLVLAKLFLERQGDLIVRIVSSAREALENCNLELYDVIVSDYQMPGMDGIAFLKEIRSQYGDIPFIIFTGRSHEKVAIDTINNGGDYYVKKGSDPEDIFGDLSRKIHEAVKKKNPEHSFSDSERHLFDIIDFIPDATFAINQHGEVIAWNRAIEEMTGISFRDMLGKGDYEYAVPFYGYHRPLLINMIDEPIEKIEQYYSNVHWAGNSLIAEAELPNPNGHKISALIKVCRHYNSTGEVIGAFELIQDLTELRQTEEELRRNQDLIRGFTQRTFSRIDDLKKIRHYLTSAMDLAKLVNWEYDLISDIFTFDERFYAMYGTDAEQEGGNKMDSATYAREFVHPKDAYMVAEEVRKAQKATDPNFVSKIEHRIIRRDGEVRYITVTFALIKDEQGNTIGTYGANQDITDRKKAEIALKSSEERFDAVTRNAGAWIWEIDPEGTFQYSNQSVEDILGYKPEELIGNVKFYEVFDPSIKDDYKEKAFEIFRSGKQFRNIINLNRHRDGSQVILSTSGTPIFDEDGIFRGYCGVDEDISEQKRTEEALRASEMRFRNIFNNVNDSILIYDLDGKIIEVNEIACRTLMYSREELLNRCIWELVKPEEQEIFKKKIQEIIRLGQIFFESTLNTKNEKPVPLEVNARKIICNGKQVILSVGRDISERVLAENALRQANRQINLLTSITRHDILNKISVILTYIDAAKIGCNDTAMLEFLSKMEGATSAIKSQIEFTRIYEDLGINKPKWQMLDSVMPISGLEGSYSIKTEVEGFSIFADTMLKKVFSNLLNNSLMHGQHVSEIHVYTLQRDDELDVIWEDDGIGISDEDKEIIFERGFGKNTGLGMFLIREILLLTNISIQETGEYGKGARFEISIPKGNWRRNPISKTI
ncbi:MAG: PAS domain S-box protein [Methanomicrobiales archaeon]|nr:PAS domain S-box protein [Methanomicrobiales archaeon]